MKTCSLFIARKSLWSSVSDSRWFRSRIWFCARCSSTRILWVVKEFLVTALIRFLSNTSFLSWWSPSKPSTWLISLSGRRQNFIKTMNSYLTKESIVSIKLKSDLHTLNNIKAMFYSYTHTNICLVFLVCPCCKNDWNKKLIIKGFEEMKVRLALLGKSL